jgi:hypothetical protein
MGNCAAPGRVAMSGQGGATPGIGWQPWTERGMGPFGVVVRHPLGQHVAQVPFVQGNDPIEALAPCGANEPLARRVGLRCPRRRAQHLERHRPECVVDRGCEDGVAIVHDEPIRRIERKSIPEPLDGPFRRRVFGDVPVQDSPRRDVEDHEDIQSLERGGHRDEEVAGEDRAGMVVQEGGPRLRRPITVGTPRSYRTTSEDPPLSNVNSYWDIPRWLLQNGCEWT